jgi:hypothetical protein
MNNMTLTLTPMHLMEGIWQGALKVSGANGNYHPEITASHLENPIDGVEVRESDTSGEWIIRVPVPADTLSDGVQTYLVNDARSGEKLASFTILAGETLDDDIRTEISLLRAELDMLKKSFRRHCVETM